MFSPAASLCVSITQKTVVALLLNINPFLLHTTLEARHTLHNLKTTIQQQEAVDIFASLPNWWEDQKHPPSEAIHKAATKIGLDISSNCHIKQTTFAASEIIPCLWNITYFPLCVFFAETQLSFLFLFTVSILFFRPKLDVTHNRKNTCPCAHGLDSYEHSTNRVRLVIF